MQTKHPFQLAQRPDNISSSDVLQTAPLPRPSPVKSLAENVQVSKTRVWDFMVGEQTTFTPLKFNMEAEKKSREKEIPFGNHHFQVSMLNFGGVTNI